MELLLQPSPAPCPALPWPGCCTRAGMGVCHNKLGWDPVLANVPVTRNALSSHRRNLCDPAPHRESPSPLAAEQPCSLQLISAFLSKSLKFQFSLLPAWGRTSLDSVAGTPAIDISYSCSVPFLTRIPQACFTLVLLLQRSFYPSLIKVPCVFSCSWAAVGEGQVTRHDTHLI